VHLGTDLDRFDPDRLPTTDACRDALGLPLHVPLAGMFCRLERWKGPHTLIAAFAEVVADEPEARCLIVGKPHPGDPSYADELHRMVADLELSENVIFPGWKADVSTWMSAVDVVVSASTNEPFGLTVIEALALGKPVVATDSGGPAEIIRSGVDGELVEPEDVHALGVALLNLLRNADRRAALSAAARERAKEFSSDRFADRFFACVGGVDKVELSP
jgi:glycosyltransferase involved in cell wall biosynthesis